MKRESYLQHVTLNQRIERLWVWEHRPCRVEGKVCLEIDENPSASTVWLGALPNQVPPSSFLPSFRFQSHLLLGAISLS